MTVGKQSPKKIQSPRSRTIRFHGFPLFWPASIAGIHDWTGETGKPHGDKGEEMADMEPIVWVGPVLNFNPNFGGPFMVFTAH
jgi:hypothetical protein